MKRLSVNFFSSLPPIFLFLDYDGTLVGLKNNRASVLLSPKMKEILKKLSGNPLIRIAIISGRVLADLKKQVALPSLILSGNHGWEFINIKSPFRGKDLLKWKNRCKVLEEHLVPVKRRFKNSYIENKRLGVSFDFRNVKGATTREVQPFLESVLVKNSYKKFFKLLAGKKAWEFRPQAGWHKGKAVEWILKQYSKWPAIPIYIGDDVTDEDAFLVIKKAGYACRMAKKRKTSADFYFFNTEDLYGFLVRLEKMYKKAN